MIEKRETGGKTGIVGVIEKRETGGGKGREASDNFMRFEIIYML